jgi:hypothetical protein
MSKTSLLKRIEGLELWTTVSGSSQQFAVKMGERRLRVVETLDAAEALLATTLLHVRMARAH